MLPDPGFNFGLYSSWVQRLGMPITQPIVSVSYAPMSGMSMSVQDWAFEDMTFRKDRKTGVGAYTLPDVACIKMVDYFAPGKHLFRLIFATKNHWQKYNHSIVHQKNQKYYFLLVHYS